MTFLRRIFKHPGPGGSPIHSTGTDQKVHAPLGRRMFLRMIGQQLTFGGEEEPVYDFGAPVDIPDYVGELRNRITSASSFAGPGQITEREKQVLDRVEEIAPGLLDRLSRLTESTSMGFLPQYDRQTTLDIRFIDRKPFNSDTALAAYHTRTGDIEIAHNFDGHSRTVEEMSLTLLHELGHRVDEMSAGRGGMAIWESGFNTAYIGPLVDFRMRQGAESLIESDYADAATVEEMEEAWSYPLALGAVANRLRQKGMSQQAGDVRALIPPETFAEAFKLYYTDRRILDDTLGKTLTRRVQQIVNALNLPKSRAPRRKKRVKKASHSPVKTIMAAVEEYDWEVPPHGVTMKELLRAISRRKLSKHPGPGGSPTHATGTDQSVHNPWKKATQRLEGQGVPLSTPDEVDKGTTEDLLATNRERKGKGGDPEFQQAASLLFQQALDNEAKLQPVIARAAQATNARLAWYGERVKYEASIESKLQRIIAEKPAIKTVEDAVADISDLNRYTFVWTTSDGEYERGVVGTIQEFMESGWSLLPTPDGGVKVRDYWEPGDAYDGLHCVFTKDGVRVEVQFHTDKSVEKKAKAHVLYEQYREMDPQSKRARVLYNEMASLWKNRDHVPEVLPMLPYAKKKKG